jgi:hypothetical protein
MPFSDFTFDLYFIKKQIKKAEEGGMEVGANK